LSARSKIPIQDVFQPIVEPKIRDDEGHLTHRAMVAVGQQDEEEFVDFQMRIAYHELMDLPDGFTGYRDIAQEVTGRWLLWLLLGYYLPSRTHRCILPDIDKSFLVF
jgi:hypothetical protein